MPTPVVLLVNDNPVTNALHEAIFEQAGFSCRLVEDGRAAVASCLAAPPAAVVMDVDMPVLDGISAMLEIRQLQEAGALPAFGIVATSAAMDAKRAAECASAGAQAMFSKPVAFEALVSAVRSAIQSTGASQQQS
jgi:CheY-like chemotaxis protein